MTQGSVSPPAEEASAPAGPPVSNGTPADGDTTRVVEASAAARSTNGVPRERPPLAGLKLGRKDRLLFLSMRTVLHIFSLLPDFVLYPLGVLGGYIGYLADRRHVAIAMINLAIAFPERSLRERRRILRASYMNLGRGGAEYIRLAGFFYRRLIRRVSYERFHYWDELKRLYPGRGIVVLSAHFGNFELMATAHALHGHQITLVHHTQRFVAGDALMTWVRERAGVDVVRKHSAARAVLKALTDGQLVGVPFDQNAKRGEAIFIPFFGEPAATSRTLARVGAKVAGGGGSGLHRARAGQPLASHRHPRSYPASRERRRGSRRGGEHGAFRARDRGCRAAVSRAVPVDTPALPHAAARDGADVRRKPAPSRFPPQSGTLAHRVSPASKVLSGT